MKGFHYLLILLQIIMIFREAFCQNRTSTIDYEENETSKVLSRRKRYLIFPEGSSFQLVLCVQTPAITLGSIVLYSNTAALAWMLPTDPKFFDNIRKNTDIIRADGRSSINYVDEKGNIMAKIPYMRKPIVNPVFAKRSTNDGPITYKEKLKIKLDRIRMHERQFNRDYLKKEHMKKIFIEFHRRSRVGLFEKLEKLFTALGQDGRRCVLNKLCEAAQAAPEQGTFLQEFQRIVFTLPKGTEEEEYKEYDKAHTSRYNCIDSYPKCYLNL